MTDLLILAGYFSVAALILHVVDVKWDDLTKDIMIVSPAQIYVARAAIFVMVVFWPVLFISASLMKKKEK